VIRRSRGDSWRRRRNESVLFACSAAALLAPAPALAHHSAAAYDQTTEIILEGTVTEVSWKSSHTYFMLEITERRASPFFWRRDRISAAGGPGRPRMNE
jgi:hypothetical protein